MEDESYQGGENVNKQAQISKWAMKCPTLAGLYNISGEMRDGTNIIFPVGSSSKRNIDDSIDIIGLYEADIQPLPSVYEEYQINCYKSLANSDNEYNILRYEEVENVIDWITQQDELLNFPDIGESVVAVEATPFVPQIRFADPESGVVCYFITLRITYVNTAKGRSVSCQM